MIGMLGQQFAVLRMHEDLALKVQFLKSVAAERGERWPGREVGQKQVDALAKEMAEVNAKLAKQKSAYQQQIAALDAEIKKSQKQRSSLQKTLFWKSIDFHLNDATNREASAVGFDYQAHCMAGCFLVGSSTDLRQNLHKLVFTPIRERKFKSSLPLKCKPECVIFDGKRMAIAQGKQVLLINFQGLAPESSSPELQSPVLKLFLESDLLFVVTAGLILRIYSLSTRRLERVMKLPSQHVWVEDGLLFLAYLNEITTIRIENWQAKVTKLQEIKALVHGMAVFQTFAKNLSDYELNDFRFVFKGDIKHGAIQAMHRRGERMVYVAQNELVSCSLTDRRRVGEVQGEVNWCWVYRRDVVLADRRGEIWIEKEAVCEQ